MQIYKLIIYNRLKEFDSYKEIVKRNRAPWGRINKCHLVFETPVVDVILKCGTDTETLWVRKHYDIKYNGHEHIKL